MRPARVLPASLGAILIVAFGVGAVTAPDDVIVLGAAFSITGKYAQNGANTKNGYDLAIKRLNEAGGVVAGGNPYKLRVRYYDDESTPARGIELAERLIKQDGVKFLLGPDAGYVLVAGKLAKAGEGKALLADPDRAGSFSADKG